MFLKKIYLEIWKPYFNVKTYTLSLKSEFWHWKFDSVLSYKNQNYTSFGL